MGLLEIFSNEMVFRIRLIGYSVLLFFSFFIIGGTASMKNESFRNIDCPLYCDKNGCGSVSNCNYPLAIAIIFQLMYLIVRFVSLILVLLGKLSTDGFPFVDPFEFIYVAIDILSCFLTFIGACILSAGTNSTCDKFDCDDFDWMPGSRAAQAGAWISFFLWLAVGFIGFLYIFREGRIPFLSGGGAAKSSAPAPGETTAPPMETPPNNPDDMSPKY